MSDLLPTDSVAKAALLLGNEPSIPIAYEINGNGDHVVRFVHGGFTKREMLAAMAMQGICGDGIPGSHHGHDETAEQAVAYADALLKELAK